MREWSERIMSFKVVITMDTVGDRQAVGTEMFNEVEITMKMMSVRRHVRDRSRVDSSAAKSKAT